jgi:hypothetical protein
MADLTAGTPVCEFSPDEIEQMLALHRVYLETEFHQGHRANFSSAETGPALAHQRMLDTRSADEATPDATEAAGRTERAGPHPGIDRFARDSPLEGGVRCELVSKRRIRLLVIALRIPRGAAKRGRRDPVFSNCPPKRLTKFCDNFDGLPNS